MAETKIKYPIIASAIVVIALLAASGCELRLGLQELQESGGTVTCSAGKLNDGATLTKKNVVRADKDGWLRNSATVRSKVGDPILRNNSDTETTKAKPERDGRCKKGQANTSSNKDRANTSNTNVQKAFCKRVSTDHGP